MSIKKEFNQKKMELDVVQREYREIREKIKIPNKLKIQNQLTNLIKLKKNSKK